MGFLTLKQDCTGGTEVERFAMQHLETSRLQVGDCAVFLAEERARVLSFLPIRGD